MSDPNADLTVDVDGPPHINAESPEYHIFARAGAHRIYGTSAESLDEASYIGKRMMEAVPDYEIYVVSENEHDE